ncbi:MAG: YceI family protein [bacterium]|nr:YceI family protein [bacterium]MDE0288279.1 YceI family protein [bacterium]MDE0437319.1 YceI family protein [bacterium]
MRRVGIAIGILLVLVVAGLAYVWFSGGSGEPSTEVTAPPVTTAAPTQSDSSEEGEAAAEEEGPPAPADTVAEEPGTTAGTATTTSAVATSPSTTQATDRDEEATAVVYRIDKAESSVRFEIDEILNGSPKRVVGTTSEVAGEILIDFDNPPASSLGAVVINVRTLETDSSFRDRAMRGPILGSARDENEFATFEPTDITGLPDRVTVGDRVSLTVVGDFTLSGVTLPVEFSVEAVVGSTERIEVSGVATVLRSDFGLTVPDVPSVSDVADEVTLAIELVAVVG